MAQLNHEYVVGKDDDVKVRCLTPVPQLDMPLPLSLDINGQIDINVPLSGTVTTEQRFPSTWYGEDKVVETVTKTKEFHAFKIIKVKTRYWEGKLKTDVYVKEIPYKRPRCAKCKGFLYAGCICPPEDVE